MTHQLVVKGYQVGAQLEQSGLRTLYKATHLPTGREMFLTVIAVRAGRSLNNLIRRAQQSKRLTLPGLVPAVDFGVLADDRFFFSHQVLPSSPIERYLSQVEGKEERLYTMIRLFIDTLEYVDYIHEAGTTHRDLSTVQFRVDHHDGAVLEGFINARPKVEPRNLINIVNMPYMAPEQLSLGQAADRRTDIYSLGVVLYELLTGVLPYESNFNKVEDARQGITPAPSQKRPEIPQELDAVCLRAMAQRGSRYSHVKQLSQELEAFYNRRSLRHKVRDLSHALKNLLAVRN